MLAHLPSLVLFLLKHANNKTIVMLALQLLDAVGVQPQNNVYLELPTVQIIRLVLEDHGNLEVALHANHLEIADNV